jgi:hypothetical protein
LNGRVDFRNTVAALSIVAYVRHYGSLAGMRDYAFQRRPASGPQLKKSAGAELEGFISTALLVLARGFFPIASVNAVIGHFERTPTNRSILSRGVLSTAVGILKGGIR